MGEVALQKYRLVNLLATGGMGEVFLARQEGPAGFVKPVVIKRILKHLASNQAFVQMFLNEARLAASLSHPNVVQIYELGFENGVYFIVMEYIGGRSLRVLRKSLKAKQRLIPPPLAARIGAQALHGLNYAHQLRSPEGESLGIVHRDVSPDNILVGFNGEVKLVDFGIAKANSTVGTTRAGTLKGKFHYMAPEQVTASAVDGRTDIYAMGVVLYELLTGARPFNGDTDPAIIFSIVSGTAPNPSDFNPSITTELQGIVLKAMSKAPEQRYATAAEMANALEDYIASTSEKVGEAQLGALMTELFGTHPQPGETIAGLRSGGQLSADRLLRPSSGQIAEEISLDDSRDDADRERRSLQVTRTDPGADTAPRAKLRWRIALLSAAAAIALLAAYLVLSHRTSDVPSSTAFSSADPGSAALKMYLDEIDRQVANKRYGPALELLRKAKETNARDPALNIRLANLTETLQDSALAATLPASSEKAEPRPDASSTSSSPDRSRSRVAVRLEPQSPPPRPAPDTEDKPEKAAARTELPNAPETAPSPVATAPPSGAPLLSSPIQGDARESASGAPIGLSPPTQGDAASGLSPPTQGDARGAASGGSIGLSPPAGGEAPKPTAAKPRETPAPVPVPTGKPAKPRLPAVFVARSSQDLFRVFQAVENQAIDIGGVPSGVARNVTLPLAQDLAGAVMGAQGIEVYPKAMYDVILEQARLGENRSRVGEVLRRVQADGSLQDKANEAP